MSTDPDPPWGDSPLDIYLLETWNTTSRDPPATQRTNLVREYVAMGWRKRRHYDNLAESADRPTPTRDQISTVLQPLRSLSQRHLAHTPSDPAAVWLRTCYDDAAAHDRLLQSFDVEDAVGSGADKLLSDADRYNYGDDWTRVFDVLPELVDPGVLAPTSRKELRRLREEVAAGKMDGLAQLSTQFVDDAAEAAKVRFKVVYGALQKAAVTNYLVVEDAEAQRAGKVWFVFLDECGRVVRGARVTRDEVGCFRGAWWEECWDEVEPWVGAVVGEEYCERGSCGPPFAGEGGGRKEGEGKGQAGMEDGAGKAGQEVEGAKEEGSGAEGLGKGDSGVAAE